MKKTQMFGAELMKLKHTPFILSHIWIPALGAAGFAAYYVMYRGQLASDRIRLIFEVTATLFPFLCSIMTGIAVMQEEQESHFFHLLSEQGRFKILLAKLLILWGFGILALWILGAVFAAGIGLGGELRAEVLAALMKLFVGAAVSSIVLYVFHLFVSLAYGFGISVFFGVFESMQAIIYSNIELAGIWRYIPFAWQIEWGKDVLNGNVAVHAAQWGIRLALGAAGVLLLVLWFERWEGRRRYEA